MDKDGKTALIIASEKGLLNIVNFLLDVDRAKITNIIHE